MSPKQVVGFTCVFNSEIDQLIRKSIVVCCLADIRSFAGAGGSVGCSNGCGNVGWILDRGEMQKQKQRSKALRMQCLVGAMMGCHVSISSNVP